MPRPRSDIAPRILAAARRRFLADGVDGSSLRRIARDAGTSIGMIYYYFPTKDDLFAAVVEDHYTALVGSLEHALSSEHSVEERLRRLFLRFAAMDGDQADVMRIVINEVLVSSARRARLGERFSRGHLKLVLQLLTDGVAEGHFRAGTPPGVLAVSVLALAVFPPFAMRLGGEPMPLTAMLPAGPALATALADILLYGISARV